MWSGPGGDEVELLEAAHLFAGWHNGIFHGPADDFRIGGSIFLSVGLCYDYFYYCAEADFRRSCVRLAIPGVHYAVSKRCSVLLHRDSGTVSGEGIYGGQKAPYISGERKIVNLNSFLTAQDIPVSSGI